MFHETAVGVVKRGDGSDDDGGAVPTVQAALDPDKTRTSSCSRPSSRRQEMELQLRRIRRQDER